MSLGNTVNKEKNGALLAYVAENVPCINLRKLLKIIIYWMKILLNGVDSH